MGLFSSNMPYFRHVPVEFYPLLFPHPQHVLGDFLPCWSVVSRISPKILWKNTFILASSSVPREARGYTSPIAIQLFRCRAALGAGDLTSWCLLQLIFQDLLPKFFWPCCDLRPLQHFACREGFGHARLMALLPSSSARALASHRLLWDRLAMGPVLGVLCKLILQLSEAFLGCSCNLPEFGIFSVLFVWTRLQSWRKPPRLWTPLPPLGLHQLPQVFLKSFSSSGKLHVSNTMSLIPVCKDFTFNFLLLSPSSFI